MRQLVRQDKCPALVVPVLGIFRQDDYGCQDPTRHRHGTRGANAQCHAAIDAEWARDPLEERQPFGVGHRDCLSHNRPDAGHAEQQPAEHEEHARGPYRPAGIPYALPNPHPHPAIHPVRGNDVRGRRRRCVHGSRDRRRRAMHMLARPNVSVSSRPNDRDLGLSCRRRLGDRHRCGVGRKGRRRDEHGHGHGHGDLHRRPESNDCGKHEQSGERRRP